MEGMTLTFDSVWFQNVPDKSVYDYYDNGRKWCYFKFPQFVGTSEYSFILPTDERLEFTLEIFEKFYNKKSKSVFKNKFIDNNRNWNKYWMSLSCITDLYEYCKKKNRRITRVFSRKKSSKGRIKMSF